MPKRTMKRASGRRAALRISEVTGAVKSLRVEGKWRDDAVERRGREGCGGALARAGKTMLDRGSGLNTL
jgi:hypothetical protein